ncbi:MAG: ribonuclease P protein component [Leptospira sp.]|nr:ribonuclease P protein component [Leptospira sp.]
MGNPPLRFLVRKNDQLVAEFLFCPDKSHKTAVQRNRTKRLLRELVRKFHDQIPNGIDCAMLTHINFSKSPAETREKIFESLVRKL